MQKATTHQNNSTNQDKMKEIKTTPVPVPNPKKADKLREADKKLIKKIIEITTPIVIGVLLSCLWLYDVNTGSTDGITMQAADPVNPPSRHQEQGLGALPDAGLAVERHEIPNAYTIEEYKKENSNDLAGQPIRGKVPGKRFEKVINDKIGLEKYGLAFCDQKYKLDVESPVYGLVEIVNKKWKKPINSEFLSIEKILTPPNESSEVFNLHDSKTGRYRRLILITFEVKEFSESSGKDVYSFTPENKARIKLVLKGVDARSQAILFEKELTHEICMMDWGRYQQVETDDISDSNPVYTQSKAMQQAIELTTDDIIGLLHKYLD